MYLGQKFFWVKKNLSRKKFRVKILFLSEIFLGQKKNLSKKFLGQKKCGSEIFLGKKMGRKFFGPNSILYDLSVLSSSSLLTADLNNNNTEFVWRGWWWVGWITDQKPCHSNLTGVGLSWAVTILLTLAGLVRTHNSVLCCVAVFSAYC